MLICNFKVNPTSQQIPPLSAALPTLQLVCNKVLHDGVNHRGMDKAEMLRVNTLIRKELKWGKKFNSRVNQTAFESDLKAINPFCYHDKRQIINPKRYLQIKKKNYTIKDEFSECYLSGNTKQITFLIPQKRERLQRLGINRLNFPQIDPIQRVRIVYPAHDYSVPLVGQFAPQNKLQKFPSMRTHVFSDSGFIQASHDYDLPKGLTAHWTSNP